MTNVQDNLKIDDVISHKNITHSRPIPLMSITMPLTEYPHALSSSSRTSISEPVCSSPTPPVSISDDTISVSSTSTLVHRTDISKFHFAHVIKVPHGTNFLASDNQSTTVCVNSVGNILHLITPTGYHIRSSRWSETEEKITDLLWCETLQVYLATTSKSLFTLKYELDQSLAVEKRLNFPRDYSSFKIFIACNSYRLYIYNSLTESIDVYTLQFAHLHTKQLPDRLVNEQIERFSCSDSFLVFHCKEMINKIVLLNPATMVIEFAFDLPYQQISSLRCVDDENILIFIGTKENGENRLVFLNFGNEHEGNEIEPIVVEKAVERDDQLVYLLPNCRDLMMLNVNTARVQYLKYRF